MTSESMRNDSPTSTGEAANRANRARALAELVVMAEHGDFDHLLDKQNYRARPPCWKFFFFGGGDRQRVVQRHQYRSADPGIGIVKQMPIDPSVGVAWDVPADAVGAPKAPRESTIAVTAAEPATLVIISSTPVS
ncbi:hypothetical protein [Nocardia seriolae]|uniref:hypothetical protein n=1 Tax=Nocardia seriolae TaxID=37332 RepID=UPI002952A6E3|nr:hypothetical protein [Nocardia seriolae]